MSDSAQDGQFGSHRPGSISSKLLDRLNAGESEAWERLVDLYGEGLYQLCRRSGIDADESRDVVQEVFQAVSQHVVDFRRERPTDSFRAWIARIARNEICNYFRRLDKRPKAPGGTTAQRRCMEVPAPTESSHSSLPAVPDCLVSPHALESVRADFENQTWDAFWRVAVEGRSPKQVAEALGMSLQSVYQAKCRVLRRLRQEFGDLLS